MSAEARSVVRDEHSRQANQDLVAAARAQDERHQRRKRKRDPHEFRVERLHALAKFIQDSSLANVTTKRVETGWGTDAVVGLAVSRLRNQQALSASGAFQTIFTPEVVELLAGLLEGTRKRHSLDLAGFGRESKQPITVATTTTYLALEIHMAATNTHKSVYFHGPNDLGVMSAKRFSLLRATGARVTIAQLSRLSSKLSSRCREIWTPTSIVAFDELLAGYKSARAHHLQAIPRKPHPLGHLYYLLVDSVVVQQRRLYFALDIHTPAVDGNHAPADAARVVLARNRKTLAHDARNVLVVMDAAFNTEGLRNWMQARGLRYLLSGLPGTHPELAQLLHEEEKIPVGQHVAVTAPGLPLVSTCCVPATNKPGDVAHFSAITNAVSVQGVCSCVHPVPEAGAQELFGALSQLSEPVLSVLADTVWSKHTTTASLVAHLTGFDVERDVGKRCCLCSAPPCSVPCVRDLEHVIDGEVQQLQQQTTKQLQAVLRDLGLPKSGKKKAELARRIALARCVNPTSLAALENFLENFMHPPAQGEGMLSALYRDHFFQVDQFNRLFYGHRLGVVKSGESLRMLLNVVNIMLVNVFAVYVIASARQGGQSGVVDFDSLMSQLAVELVDEGQDQ